MKQHALLLVAVAALVLAAVTALHPPHLLGEDAAPPSPRVSPHETPTPTLPAIRTSHDPYIALGQRLHQRGVRVWYETDLVSSWLAGPAAFRRTVARLHTLSRVPGVVGFKIADELGYGDGLKSAAETTRFLRAANRSLGRVAPGKEILVDAIVPALGCLPWRGAAEQACAAAVDQKYPAATIEAMQGYLRAGLLDRLDLSTGLLDESTYAGWGTSLADAQQDVWAHVDQWGWGRLTTLQARKALADVGGFQGDRAQAAADTDVYVTAPVAAGARAVDVWTWRQPYDGHVVSLLGARLAPNPLWSALRTAHADGADLFTHMTPSAMPTRERAIDEECDRAAQVFDDVFVAAGTG
jgi:hypothetical protein